MSRNAEPEWLSTFIRSAGATGRVLGIAVGGSHGRGTSDELSDVDLFFLIDSVELLTLYGTPPSHLTDLIPGRTAVSYPALVPEFGLKYTVVSSEIGLCDLFFEDTTGSPTPLRAGTEIRWDPDGRFAALNSDLLGESQKPEARTAHATRMAVQLASEYAGATKSISRGRTVQARYRISKVVNLLLGVRRSAEGSWWFSHSVADEALTDPAATLAQGVSEALAKPMPTETHRLLGNLCMTAIEETEGLPPAVKHALISQVSRAVEAVGG